MTASELLNHFNEFLLEQNKKPGPYLRAASAFFRKQESEKALGTILEDTIIQSSDSHSYLLGALLEFMTTHGHLTRRVKNDFESVFAKDIEIIETYCDESGKYYVKSYLNQFLKAAERNELTAYFKQIPDLYKSAILGFVTWLEENKIKLSISIDLPQVIKQVTPEVKEEDRKYSREEILQLAKRIKFSDEEMIMLHLVLIGRLSIVEFSSLPAKSIIQWCEKNAVQPELIELIKDRYPRKNDLVYHGGKVQAERAATKILAKFELKNIQSMTDWRKYYKP